jgi:hypothetical protein
MVLLKSNRPSPTVLSAPMLGIPDVNPPTPPFGRDLASSSLKTSSNVPITPALPNPPERRILERVREPGRCPGVHPDRLLALCLGDLGTGLALGAVIDLADDGRVQACARHGLPCSPGGPLDRC